MFSYQSGINAASFISSERENTLSEVFFENFVANELVAKGLNLFYWRGKASAGFEFIIESDNKFAFAIKVSKNNYGYNAERKLLTIPLYSVCGKRPCEWNVGDISRWQIYANFCQFRAGSLLLFRFLVK